MEKISLKVIVDAFKEGFKGFVLGNIILQILFLIFGIVLFMSPFMTTEVIGVIIGIYFLLFGLLDAGEFFIKKKVPIFKHKIFESLFIIVVGIFIIFNPFKIRKILTFALGIYLIIISIFKLLEAVALKKWGYDGWNILLVASIILLVFGVFVTINPIAAMDVIEVAAIFIILTSILEICNLLMFYSRANDIMKLF